MDKKRSDGFQSIEFLGGHDQRHGHHDLDLRNERHDHHDGLQAALGAHFQCGSPQRSAHYVPVFEHSPSALLDNCILQTSPAASSTSSILIESQQDYAISPLMPAGCRSPRSSLRCPACREPMRTYYCVKCIQSGKFIALNEDGKFNEMEMAEEEQDSARAPQQTESFSEEEQTLDELLQLKYRNLIKKTVALKNLFHNQKMKLKQTLNFLEETKAQLEHERKSNKSTEGKIELIKKYITSRKASIEKRRGAESTLSDDLRQYINRRAFQLTNDVFPLEEINLFEKSHSFVNMETSPLLTFSDSSHHQIEQQTAFSIVEPWLPSDGDYSSYSLWVNDNREHLTATMSDPSERNPAFRIGAALAYTTQLIQNLASYLDVILPARLDLAAFNRELLDDIQFSYNVAKLNSNIIHLCITQGVDISLLHPQKTLKNLMLLFNINLGDLGRKPIIELDDEEAAMKIEEKLALDLGLIQESFYDFSKFATEDENSDSEWEISDSINTPEIPMQTEQSIQQNSYISRFPLRLLTSFWGAGS